MNLTSLSPVPSRRFTRRGHAEALVFGLAWLALSTTASAQRSPAGTPTCGQGETIEDDTYDGTLDPVACCAFEVSDGPVSMQSIKFFVAISHSQVGDLTIKLESPEGTVATMMSRPGFAEPDDDGAGCCGSETDWDGDLLRFDDAAAVSAEAMGASGEAVCTKDGICDYASAPGSATGLGLADFDGENPNGTWFCCAGDSEEDGDGTLDDCFVDLALFADGFESGGTTLWSSTVP